MEQSTQVMSLDDVAVSLGFTPETMNSRALQRFSEANLRYQVLENSERDDVLKTIIQVLYSQSLSVVGKERLPVWEGGWSENLQAFIQSNFDVKTLLPRYVHVTRPLRWQQQYIRGTEPNLESRYVQILRPQLFGHFFDSVDSVYEFGCGTGMNLMELANLFPTKSIVGLDWTQASCDIVALLHQHVHTNIQVGGRFNFFEPDMNLKLSANSGVLTAGALEQVGSNFHPFLNFLLAQKPKVVMNLEPIAEVYDENILVDYLAAEYHRKRGYLDGFVTELKHLESQGKVRILKLHRTGLGSLFNEGYSYIVWEPI